MALPEDDVEEVDPEPALASVLDHEHDALVIGPGLRPSLAIGELLRLILTASEEGGGPPAVLDAEALRTLAAVDEWWTRVTRPCVLTPHTGEFARLRAGSGHAAEEDGDLSADDAARARAADVRRRASGTRSSCSRAPRRSSPPRTARWPWRRSRTRRWRPAAPATSWRARSARCSRRASRRTTPRGWASTSTGWPARPCATGSATPGCSPATCRRRSRSGASAWPGSRSASKTGRRLGFGVRTEGSDAAAADAGTPAQAGPATRTPEATSRLERRTSAASRASPSRRASRPPACRRCRAPPGSSWTSTRSRPTSRRSAGSSGPGVRVEPVVKADAYGHGAVPIARALAAAGADGLSVATVDEAFELRDGGIDAAAPRPVPGPARAGRGRRRLVDRGERRVGAADGGDPRGGGGGRAPVARPTSRCTSRSRRASGAAGRCPARPPTRVRAVVDAPGVRLGGVWTHLVAADDVSGTRAQDARFRARRLGARRHARARARRRAPPPRGERRDPRRRRRPLGRRPARARDLRPRARRASRRRPRRPRRRRPCARSWRCSRDRCGSRTCRPVTASATGRRS